LGETVDIYSALHRAILNNIPDQAWLKDRDSRYILVNDAFMAACGLPEENILERTPADVWSASWARKYLRTDRAVVRSGQRSRYEESRCGKDGKLRWYDTIKTPIRDEHGEVIGTVGISRDITESKRAQQELLASRTQLRELSAYLESVREAERTRISRELHDELGQSLTALRLGLNLLESQGHGAHDWRTQVQMLKAIADSTVESVQRIAADLRPPMLDELGLIAAIEWLAESMAERGGMQCTLRLPATPCAFGRELSTAIFRITQESLTNACRHGRASHVLVVLCEEPALVRLRISDNGRGIESSPDRRYRSLGLLGMHERALMLGGRLTVQSEPGAGTCVEAELPKAGARAATE